MHRYLITILFSLVCFSQEHYLIPDAGAPGMTVYVEFVGIHDQPEYFMPNSNLGNSLFLNNEGDFNTIKPLPGFEDILDVGPFIVSWNGRLISTQIFINEDANPNSSNYNELEDQYIVPIEVNFQGRQSRTFSFHVVQPFPFGDRSTEFGDLGDGNLGNRSSRNTMVVDEMILGPGTYGYSTINPDPNTNGNQSYLPLIILSKGDIIGDNTIIDVSANGKNGGPGGGGGGGSVCDIVGFGPSGDDGGAGFTGGGAGGTNNSFPSQSTFENGGTGSGSFPISGIIFEGVNTNIGGSSINGVYGGATLNTSAQSSSGGTGHPFGSFAFGNDGGQADEDYRPGGYGAGTGNTNSRPGGSASNHTEGTADSDYEVLGIPNSNNGEIHGNEFGVPFYGGSGGGSGNPQGAGECSGDGGGGGGAIRIFAPNISNVQFFAQGAGGQERRSNDDGGNGSGGFVEINAKHSFTNLSVNTDGGINEIGIGGSGRLRINSLEEATTIVNQDSESSRFVGFATDTNKYVSSSDEVLGFKNNEFEITYYVKPKDGSWTSYRTFQTNETDISIPLNNMDQNVSKTWYGIAVANHDGFQQDPHQEIPEFILSQSGANIFYFSDSPQPEIECEEEIDLTLSNCNDDQYEYELIIENIGDADLEIELTSASFSEDWISILNPADLTFSTTYLTSLMIDKTSLIEGDYSATISFPTNDIDENPKIIVVNLTIEGTNFFYQDSNNNQISEYKKEICLYDTDTFLDRVILSNGNSSAIQISNVRFSQNNLILRSLDENFQILPGEPFDIEFELSTLITTNPEQGEYLDTLIFDYDNCSRSLPLSLAIDNDFLIPVNQTQFDFGKTTINTSQTNAIVFRYIGHEDRQLLGVNTLNNPFSLASQTPQINDQLTYGDFVTLNIDFTPTQSISFTNQFEFELSNEICDEENYLIRAKGSEDRLIYESFIDLGDVEYCQIIDTLLTLANNGEEIILAGTISGISDELELNLAGASRISENSSLTYSIEFNANSATIGEYNGFWAIDVLNVPGIDEIRVNVRANVYQLEFNWNPIVPNFGNNAWGVWSNTKIFDLEMVSDIGSASFLDLEGEGVRYLGSSNNFDQINKTSSYSFSIFNSEEISSSFTKTFTLQSNNDCIYEIEIPYQANFLNQDLTAFYNEVKEPFTICDDIEIFNLLIDSQGPGSVTITNISYEGDNNSLFSNTLGLPYDINSQEQLQFYLNVKELGFGEFSTTVNFEYLGNNETRTVSEVFEYEKRKGLNVFDENGIIPPEGMDFGFVLVGQTSIMSATIARDYNWNYAYENPDNTDLIPEFLFDPPYNNTNSAIQGPEVFSVTFSPSSEDIFRDTLRFPIIIIDNQFDECRDTLIVPLYGNGGNSLDILVETGDVVADENFTDIEIPIFINSFGNTNTFTGVTIDSLNILMNRTVFLPEGLSKGFFNSVEYLNDDTLLINIRIEDLDIYPNTQNKITDIIGSPLLGNTKVTQISPYDLLLEDRSLLNSATYSSGSFTLTVCEDGEDRLLVKGSPLKVDIIKQIGEIEIDITTLEVGDHFIELVDINGNTIYQEIIQNQQVGSINSLTINSSQFANGVYYLRINAPNDFVIKSIILSN